MSQCLLGQQARLAQVFAMVGGLLEAGGAERVVPHRVNRSLTECFLNADFGLIKVVEGSGDVRGASWRVHQCGILAEEIGAVHGRGLPRGDGTVGHRRQRQTQKPLRAIGPDRIDHP